MSAFRRAYAPPLIEKLNNSKTSSVFELAIMKKFIKSSIFNNFYVAMKN